MEEDKLSFLNSDKGADPAPEPAATPVQTPENSGSPGQPRDDSGRFAPKAADAPAPTPTAAAPTPQAQTPAPASQPAPTPEPKQEAIPLATALDWRDQLKANKRELETLKAQIAQQQRQPQQVPSAQQDPEGYAAYLENIATSTRVNTRFEMSEALAREKHGDDATQGAMDWAMGQAQTSPAFAAEYLQQRHPIDWAVKQQKRHALMTAIGDDPEAYIAAEIAKRSQPATASTPEPQSQQAASPQPAAATPTPAPPKSIVNQPGATGSLHTIPTGPGAAFAAVFDRS